jgi:hypothetical protein
LFFGEGWGGGGKQSSLQNNLGKTTNFKHLK